jgi:hypothetical protein
MHRCPDCGWVGDTPATITQEDVDQHYDTDEMDFTPEEYEAACSEVGQEICPECSAPYLEDADGG